VVKTDTEHDTAELAQRIWTKLSEGDWEGAKAHLGPNYVQEWPQSGERIVGAEDALAIDRDFPGGMPAMTFRRTVASGDLAVLEVGLEYADGSVYQGVSIMEFRDGKLVKETDYFAQPFEAPQWRAQWVERM
jgi:ketosteroid isomerase-like protein